MQNRTVTKLLVEVNMLSRLTHEPKPASLNAKEIYNDVEDIYARLIKLNNKIAKARGIPGLSNCKDSPCV